MNIPRTGKTKFCKEVLPNGLTVVTIEMPHIHTLEVGMFVRAGLRFESKENNGISHFLEHMMFRGNKSYPDSLLLNREFEEIGKDLRASTLSEYTYYGFAPHVSQLEKGLELFADFFTEPIFSKIELERGIILEEYFEDINAEGNDTDINNIACALMYEGNPLAMTTIGVEKSINRIDEKLLRGYFDEFYGPGNMILVGAGALSHERFLDSAKKYFDPLKEHGVSIGRDHFQGSVNEDQKAPQIICKHDSDSQIQLQICFRSLSYNHPDYYSAELLGRLFDDGVTSRLQRILREDRGLVYSVECRATSLSDIGTFDFDVQVRSEKVTLVANILFEEIKKILQDGISDDELAHVKKRYLYDLDYDQDDPYKYIVRYGLAQMYSTEISVEKEKAILEGIAKEDLMRLAGEIFVPAKLNVVLLGPVTPELEKEIKKVTLEF